MLVLIMQVISQSILNKKIRQILIRYCNIERLLRKGITYKEKQNENNNINNKELEATRVTDQKNNANDCIENNKRKECDKITVTDST